MKTKKNHIPVQIPASCTETFNIRIHPWRKDWLKHVAEKHNISMTKVWLNVMDSYLENALTERQMMI